MSTQGEKIVPNTLPPNNVKPLEAGASNVFQSAAMKSTNQNQLQTSLAQTGGIKKRRKSMRGGAVASSATPRMIVQPAASYDTNKGGTNANNTQIAALNAKMNQQSTYDNPGGSQADLAVAAAKNQELYNTKGGSFTKKRRSSNKKGGTVPIWGCFSGGKKSRKHNKKCKCKGRKSRKHTRRHRH